jgi:hypothetical protein
LDYLSQYRHHRGKAQLPLNDKMKKNNVKRLRELKKLKDEGFLTNEEYEIKRKAIVDSI